MKISNIDGWHPADFLSWCGPAGVAVMQAARQIVDRMTLMQVGDELLPAEVPWRVSAWANVSTQGDGTGRMAILAHFGPAFTGWMTAVRSTILRWVECWN